MDNTVISIFGNQTLKEIISELKIFSKFKIKFFSDLSAKKNLQIDNNVIIYFLTRENKEVYNDLVKKNLPIIQIKNVKQKNNLNATIEVISIPFRILDLEKKNYFCNIKT